MKNMKKTGNKSVAWVILLVGWGIFILMSFYTFYMLQEKRETIKQQMLFALQETVIQDYQARHKQNLVSSHNPSPGSKKVKSIQIKTKEGKETFTFKDSIEDNVAEQLAGQYVLAQFCPIAPNDFNALYKKNLSKYSISGRTGIIYNYNGQKQYSDNDSTSFHSAAYTPVLPIDIKETANIQAWVDYDWKTLFNHIAPMALWGIIAYGIVMVGVSVSTFLERKKEKKEILVNEEDYIKIGGLLLRKDSKKLYIDGQECAIAAFDFDLLVLFAEAPGYFLTREDIKEEFWPKIDDATNNINAHISTLRAAIKDFPQYEITTEKGRGYSLTFPNASPIA